MAEGGWPDLGDAVFRELRQHPGRIALLAAAPDSDAAAARLADLAGQAPLAVGRLLAEHPELTNENDLLRLLGGSVVLTDVDGLFWQPRFRLDVLRLLRVLARREAGVVSVWPGTLDHGEARYSEPGRPDYYRQPLTDALVLHPRATTFDDDPPFDITRIA